jgi:CBS domain containing-hemolysin-like protein
MIWIIFSVSIVMAFLLAGIESALLTVSRLRVRHAASEGDKTAGALMNLLEHRNELAQVAIAVNHLFALAAFVSLALALSHWFGVWCILLALLIALPVFLIGLELFPKWLFRRYPFRILKRLMPLLGSLRVLAGPWLGLHRWVLSKRPAAPIPTNGANLIHLSESIVQLKVLPRNAEALIQQFAVFSHQCASDLMLPMSKVSALPADLPLRTASRMAQETKTRHHAVMNTEGAWLGQLDTAMLPLQVPEDKLVRQFTKPMPSVRSGDTALRCLQTMRRSNAPLALVNNEKGDAVGLLSLATLLQKMML